VRGATGLLISLGLRWRGAAERRRGILGETEGGGRWAALALRREKKKTLHEGARAAGTKDRRDKADRESCPKDPTTTYIRVQILNPRILYISVRRE
jgi:hypothetical protein